jgi:peptidylprolyl isomerase
MPPMHKGLLIIVACLALLVAGCGSDSSTSTSGDTTAPGDTTAAEQPSEPAKKKTKPKVTPPKGPAPKKLVVEDLEEGSGPAAKAGDEVTVQYVGVGYKTGKQFDASWDRGEPFTFTLGGNEVIAGWEQGVEGMKAGGRRELVIPPDLAYGSEGAGVIAPNATLVFVIDLLAIK